MAIRPDRSYVDAVFAGNTFRIASYSEKPCQPAFETLKNIEKAIWGILTGQLVYKKLEEDDLYSELPADKLVFALVSLCKLVVEKYFRKSFLSHAMKSISKTVEELVGPVFPQLPSPILTQKIGEIVEFSDLPSFARINRSSSRQVQALFMRYAQQLGCATLDPVEAKRFIQGFFQEVRAFQSKKIIASIDGSQDPVFTIKKLRFLTTEDVFNIYSCKEIYTFQFRRLFQYLSLHRDEWKVLTPQDEMAKLKGSQALILATKTNTSLFLLKHGADPSLPHEHGVYPLHYAASLGNLELVKALLEYGAPINAVGQGMSTVLHHACLPEDALGCQVIEFLLAKGADPHVFDDEGSYPLHRAAKFGQVASLKILLENSKQPLNAKRLDGSTPLACACDCPQENAEIVKILLEAGADPNIPTVRGSCPLHFAVRRGHYHIAQLLLEKGALIDQRGEKGMTPLYIACASDLKNYRKNTQLVKLLLVRGANTEICADNGASPLHNTVHGGFVDLTSLLLAFDANIHAEFKGWTPLHLAAKQIGPEALALVVLLHQCGAHFNSIANGQTPLDLAEESGYEPMIKFLMSHGALKAKQMRNFEEFL